MLELLDDCMPPLDQVYAVSNLYFMIAASYNNADLSLVYHLLRQVPSLVNCIKPSSHNI